MDITTMLTISRYLLLLLSIVICININDHHILIYALRNNEGTYPLVVDYHEQYYYKDLREKMLESLSISNCSMDGDVSIYNLNHLSSDLSIKIIHPPLKVIEKWNDEHKLKQFTRIFASISDNLCRAKKYINIAKGYYKRAKGCYKVYIIDKNGMKQKRFNDYGATLHPEHIRCENTLMNSICHKGNSTGLHVVDPSLRSMNTYPFLVTAKQVLISKSGMFGMPCGPFGLFSSCEAVKWGVPSANATIKDIHLCRKNNNNNDNTNDNTTSKACPYIKKRKVFVMTQYDDTQIGQYMQEALPKLIYHIDFLLANPDIYIHYGFSKRSILPSFVLPHYFFHALHLEHRLINGTIYADEVYMPREGGCQDIGYNAWEVVTMREKLLEYLDIHESIDFQTITSISKPYFEMILPKKPVLLVVSRSSGPYVQNKADHKRRKWDKNKYPRMLQTLSENFPKHSIEIFSDLNNTLMQCPLCQVKAFFEADIVVGMHGAGLSNAMFMRPGGILIEVVYDFDARHAPIIGIFPRLSSIIGLHHYTVFIGEGSNGGLDVIKFANDSANFVYQARLWAPKIMYH